MSGDHGGAAFAGFRAAAPPSGALEGVRSGQDAVLVDRQGLDRRVDADHRDADADRFGDLPVDLLPPPAASAEQREREQQGDDDRQPDPTTCGPPTGAHASARVLVSRSSPPIGAGAAPGRPRRARRRRRAQWQQRSGAVVGGVLGSGDQIGGAPGTGLHTFRRGGSPVRVVLVAAAGQPLARPIVVVPIEVERIGAVGVVDGLGRLLCGEVAAVEILCRCHTGHRKAQGGRHDGGHDGRANSHSAASP